MDPLTRNSISSGFWAVGTILADRSTPSAILHNLQEVGPVKTIRGLFADWEALAYLRASGRL